MNRVRKTTPLSSPIPVPGSGGDAGSRLAGQAAVLRTAAALVERLAEADPDAHIFVRVTPWPNYPIDVQPSSPVGRELTEQDKQLIQITLMEVLAGLLDAPLIVTPQPDECRLWLACKGSFLGQPVHAFTQVRDDPDLVEAANRLAAVGDEPGHDGDTSAGTPVVA